MIYMYIILYLAVADLTESEGTPVTPANNTGMIK